MDFMDAFWEQVSSFPSEGLRRSDSRDLHPAQNTFGRLAGFSKPVKKSWLRNPHRPQLLHRIDLASNRDRLPRGVEYIELTLSQAQYQTQIQLQTQLQIQIQLQTLSGNRPGTILIHVHQPSGNRPA